MEGLFEYRSVPTIREQYHQFPPLPTPPSGHVSGKITVLHGGGEGGRLHNSLIQ